MSIILVLKDCNSDNNGGYNGIGSNDNDDDNDNNCNINGSNGNANNDNEDIYNLFYKTVIKYIYIIITKKINIITIFQKEDLH